MIEHLKCDAAGCDHVEDVDQITEDHVGMPCPKCGANLLTEEDWAEWKPMQALISAMERAGYARPDPGEQTVAMRVGVHGKKTTIEIDREGGE
ncbi:hypothetical protein [Tranquillimonas rosea]|uniref:hypothetical protein n=1 Tax=Tranquillimonas rosea TaxID=641238 RepID=UPI003BAD2842